MRLTMRGRYMVPDTESLVQNIAFGSFSDGQRCPRNVHYGSKAEKLTASKCCPFYPQ